jgi:hypothetical protein
MEYTFYKLSIAGKCYVGSTENFDARMKHHTSSCNNEGGRIYHLKVYQYMRQNGGFEKVDIMIIDKIIYNNKDEAREMETKFMLMFNAELNGCYPKRSEKEWRETNKESITKQRRNFYQENKERLNKRTQQYYEEHKKEIAETTRKYREANKEKIKQHKSEKVVCDICSKMISRSHLSRHKKTQH